MRGLQIAGGVLFAAVVPRLMGPSGYGQVAMLLSLSMLASLMANLGFTEVLGRESQRYLQAQDQQGLSELFGRLLVIRIFASLLTATLYLVLTRLWLRDLDFVAAALLAVAVMVRAFAALCFALQLGLNRAARWGVAEILRQWGNMALMLPGYLIGGVRGAAAGALLLEMVVVAVGIAGVRSYLRWSTLRLQLAKMMPSLRFGVFFYAADLVSAVFERSSDVLLRSARGDYAQIGFFRVAYSVYSTGATGIPRLTLALAPLLAMLYLENRQAAVRAWIERLTRWLAVACTVVMLAAILVGRELIPLVLGRAFEPVVPSMMVLTAGLIFWSLTSVATLVALTYNRPHTATVASLVRLTTFWLLGPFLVARLGGLGASLGVLGALIAQAVYSTVAMQRVANYSLRGCFAALFLGALFLPLGLLHASLLAKIGLLGLSLLGYAILVYCFRLISPAEWAAMRGVLRRTVSARSVAAQATEPENQAVGPG